jgi:hypothetical protein
LQRAAASRGRSTTDPAVPLDRHAGRTGVFIFLSNVAPQD